MQNIQLKSTNCTPVLLLGIIGISTLSGAGTFPIIKPALISKKLTDENIYSANSTKNYQKLKHAIDDLESGKGKRIILTELKNAYYTKKSTSLVSKNLITDEDIYFSEKAEKIIKQGFKKTYTLEEIKKKHAL
jgi:hypothetical protein